MLNWSMDTLKTVFEDVVNRGSPNNQTHVTEEDFKKAYQQHKSITGYLPWIDIVDDNKVLLDDAVSVAAVYELTTIPSEARSEDYMIGRGDAIESFICNTFPEQRKAPWVVSTYNWRDTAGFRKLPEQLREYAYQQYAKRKVDPEPYTDWFIDEIFTQHIEDLARKEGFFNDPLFGDIPWRGNERKLYLTFYRRNVPGIQRKRGQGPEQELDQQCRRLEKMVKSLGLKAKRLDGESIRNWLFLWLNPNPKLTNGDSAEWLKQNPYRGNTTDDPLADYDLSTDVVSRDTRSDANKKYWYFDGQPHTVISVERMTGIPAIGQLSAERYKGDPTRPDSTIDSFFDSLPEGAVIITTFIVTPQTQLKKDLDGLEKRSKGDSPEAKNTRSEIKHARTMLAARNTKLFPYSLAIAIRAEDDDALEQAQLEIDAALTANSFHAIDYDDDDLMLDRYIRFLPMAYDPELDQLALRERVIYSHHLANLIPLYGRSVGTGNPGVVSFNRGGEPVLYDMFNSEDRSRNAHLFLFGPTGAGKSSMLAYLMMLLTAIYFPRWVVIEAGSSFNLVVELFRKMGLSVSDIVLRKGHAPSLAPFKSALKLVDSEGNPITLKADADIDVDALADELASDSSDEAEAKVNDSAISSRDILGELIIIARLMVTGGEENEEERMTRADKGLLKMAIMDAASTARKSGKEDVLTEDIIRTLRAMVSIKPERADRITEMADAMELFCDDFAGELFNRPGEELGDVDFIRIDMGSLASGNDNDKLTVAYISIINQIIARAERTQRDGRQTINLTDEAHVITGNKLLSMYLVIVAKLMGRRMGLWLWQATQNMEDYKEDAKKMLSMFEWWVMLNVDKKELDHIERFRELTEDQKTMLLSTRKVDKKYSEGVTLSSNVEAFFRNIPPPLCFALCMTEKHEKTQRAHIMEEKGCTELEAVYHVAESIRQSRLTKESE